jgi:hypothetical protein
MPEPTPDAKVLSDEQESRDIHVTLIDANSGLREKIVRNLGDYTVALLAISDNPERLELAGTGTLISTKGQHYILTARHVWDEVLADADHVGITLKPNINHRFGIDRKDLTVFGLPKPAQWNEWGPDLILLRLPKERVGSMALHKVFLNIDKAPQKINRLVLWIQVLMGTPAAHSKITDAHAQLQIDGMFLGPEKLQERNGLDYADYEINLKFPVPRDFGGVSGVGLWHVYLYKLPENGEIDWSVSLHGTAFYQLDIVNEHRPIRCHGPESIKAVIATVLHS